MKTEDKAHILKTLEDLNQPFGTLATVSESGQPEAAFVYFLHNSDLCIYFLTKSASRKFINLSKNPKAAFAISGVHPPITIQIEGIVAEVMNPEEQVEYYNKLAPFVYDFNPATPLTQMVEGEMVLMKLTPTWARVGNFHMLREGEAFTEVSFA